MSKFKTGDRVKYVGTADHYAWRNRLLGEIPGEVLGREFGRGEGSTIYRVQFEDGFGPTNGCGDADLELIVDPVEVLAERVAKLESAIEVVTPEPYKAESWGADTRVLGRTFTEWVQLIRDKNEAEYRVLVLEDRVRVLEDEDARAGRREAEAQVRWRAQLDTHEWVTVHYGAIPGGSRRTQERKY